MEQTAVGASPKWRAVFCVIAVATLGLWALSLVPAIKNWNNPNEDGFSLVPGFYATIIFRPCGFCALVGAISPQGRRFTRARTASFIGGGFLVLVGLFELLALMSD